MGSAPMRQKIVRVSRARRSPTPSRGPGAADLTEGLAGEAAGEVEPGVPQPELRDLQPKVDQTAKRSQPSRRNLEVALYVVKKAT